MPRDISPLPVRWERRRCSQSPRGRIKYATEISATALEVPETQPATCGMPSRHGNVERREVMRLNGFMRLIAKNILGGKVFGAASWKEAVRNMEAAVCGEPDRIVHHLDMAEVYRDVGEKAKAQAELETDFACRRPISTTGDFKEIQADRSDSAPPDGQTVELLGSRSARSRSTNRFPPGLRCSSPVFVSPASGALQLPPELLPHTVIPARRRRTRSRDAVARLLPALRADEERDASADRGADHHCRGPHAHGSRVCDVPVRCRWRESWLSCGRLRVALAESAERSSRSSGPIVVVRYLLPRGGLQYPCEAG